ncbi:hypothetical protein ACFRJ1_28880 [Streptomyces sp. NPDC056773]|uniref:hypothetical protein n=1 Tax=unclassified Streptomyces TaxID=2593676 RepID=UPI0020B86672|nr:hypothetical protein [Streptomyces sp. TBY4]MCP3756862.1 hypothetical protein [Streptomyces sp. TBY4]
MASLAWLLIPLFAAIGAAIWGSWAARDRTAGDISELAGYARFREAMGQSGPGGAAKADAGAQRKKDTVDSV